MQSRQHGQVATFSLLGGIVLRTGESAGNLTGSGDATDPSEINTISSCLGDDVEVEVDDDLFPREALVSFGNSDLSEFHEFDEYLKNNFNLDQSGPHLIDSINEADPDENEANDYIHSIVDTWAGEFISTICDEMSVDEYDVYESVFTYTGWEAGRVFVDIIEDEDEDLINLEIEQLFAFDCDLDENSIAGKLKEVSDSEISPEITTAIHELIKAIKQVWFPEYQK
jgi:hypothetical protein